MLFIDYSKSFDPINHRHLFKDLEDLGFAHHLIDLIQSLYQQHTAAVCWHGDLTPWFKVEKGTRQGCKLSPGLYNISAEVIRRRAEIQQSSGVSVGGRNVKVWQYADDTVLFSEREEWMQDSAAALETVSKDGHHLFFNAKKTKVMVATRRPAAASITVDG